MRLSKSEKYAINWLDGQGKSETEIAQELNVTEKQVTAYLEKSRVTNKKTNIKTGSSAVKKPKHKNLMITNTSAKKDKGVTIMTKEASEVFDDEKKKVKRTSTRNQDAIFRPNK